MSNHPANLALRFGLEMAALAALVAWALRTVDGIAGVLLAIALPTLAATAWATLRTPGDDSHGGSVPIAVPGVARLGLEALLFVAATLALLAAGYRRAGIGLGVLVTLHYVLSWDRVLRLWRGRPRA
ncbi:MAG: hypothetical protein KatS3mg051_0643 [Anaerolineae bacterium]|nr:MAG: hypothetical protein KatS3mg051_0643 [Anaerolineae bacterium]